jgi:hypothetical protein
VRLYIGQPEGNNLRILTATLIALSTIFAGTAYAAQPNPTQTHPAVLTPHQRHLREQMPPVVKETLPAHVPNDKSKRCPQWEPKIAEAGLPVQTFSYIAWRESGCNPKAVNARWNAKGQIVWTLNKNGSYDSGLFQHNSSWLSATRQVCGVNTGNKRKDLEALYNVDCSIAMAVWIMENTKGKLGNWNL